MFRRDALSQYHIAISLGVSLNSDNRKSRSPSWSSSSSACKREISDLGFNDKNGNSSFARKSAGISNERNIASKFSKNWGISVASVGIVETTCFRAICQGLQPRTAVCMCVCTYGDQLVGAPAHFHPLPHSDHCYHRSHLAHRLQLVCRLTSYSRFSRSFYNFLALFWASIRLFSVSACTSIRLRSNSGSFCLLSASIRLFSSSILFNSSCSSISRTFRLPITGSSSPIYNILCYHLSARPFCPSSLVRRAPRHLSWQPKTLRVRLT